MIARNHLLLAGLGWYGAAHAATGHQWTWAPSTNHEWFLGLAVSMAAGLAPDIDHPDATITRRIGPAGRIASAAVNTAAGGHRKLTHTVWAAVAATAAANAAQHRPDVARVVVTILCGLAAAVVARSFRLPTPRVWGLVAGAISYTAATPVARQWLGAAVAVGYMAHLAGDTITVSGLRPFAPLWDRRVAVPLLRTGPRIEDLATLVLAIPLAAAVIEHT